MEFKTPVLLNVDVTFTVDHSQQPEAFYTSEREPVADNLFKVIFGNWILQRGLNWKWMV